MTALYGAGGTLTGGGQIVMINNDASIAVTCNGSTRPFAACYDGTVYESDYIFMDQLGQVSKYSDKLTIDEDGNTIYVDEDGFIYRLEGDSFVYTGERSNADSYSGDAALKLIQGGYYVTAVKDTNGYITGYTLSGQTVTDGQMALTLFKVGGTGVLTLNAAYGAYAGEYRFYNGEVVRMASISADISGAQVLAWLLSSASAGVDLVYRTAAGVATVIDGSFTQEQALRLIYEIPDGSYLYTDSSNNRYELVTNGSVSNLEYRGFVINNADGTETFLPSTDNATITAAEAYAELKAMTIGYKFTQPQTGETIYLMFGELELTSAAGWSKSDAAFAASLMYVFQDGFFFRTKADADNSDSDTAEVDFYWIDGNGDLVYAGTNHPADMPNVIDVEAGQSLDAQYVLGGVDAADYFTIKSSGYRNTVNDASVRTALSLDGNYTGTGPNSSVSGDLNAPTGASAISGETVTKTRTTTTYSLVTLNGFLYTQVETVAETQTFTKSAVPDGTGGYIYTYQAGELVTETTYRYEGIEYEQTDANSRYLFQRYGDAVPAAVEKAEILTALKTLTDAGQMYYYVTKTTNNGTTASTTTTEVNYASSIYHSASDANKNAALDMLYGTGSTYTDANGLIYNRVSGALNSYVYANARENTIKTISGADTLAYVQSQLVYRWTNTAAGRTYYYNNKLTAGQALAMMFPTTDGGFTTTATTFDPAGLMLSGADHYYRLDDATLVYKGQKISFTEQDLSANRSLQEVVDDGCITDYTYNGQRVSELGGSGDMALKVFSLIAPLNQKYRDADGNVYFFIDVDGDGKVLTETDGGVDVLVCISAELLSGSDSYYPDVLGSEAVQWLMANRDGYYFIGRAGTTAEADLIVGTDHIGAIDVAYLYTDALSASDALRIVYNLVYDADNDCYTYTTDEKTVAINGVSFCYQDVYVLNEANGKLEYSKTLASGIPSISGAAVLQRVLDGLCGYADADGNALLTKAGGIDDLYALLFAELSLSSADLQKLLGEMPLYNARFTLAGDTETTYDGVKTFYVNRASGSDVLYTYDALMELLGRNSAEYLNKFYIKDGAPYYLDGYGNLYRVDGAEGVLSLLYTVHTETLSDGTQETYYEDADGAWYTLSFETIPSGDTWNVRARSIFLETIATVQEAASYTLTLSFASIPQNTGLTGSDVTPSSSSVQTALEALNCVFDPGDSTKIVIAPADLNETALIKTLYLKADGDGDDDTYTSPDGLVYSLRKNAAGAVIAQILDYTGVRRQPAAGGGFSDLAAIDGELWRVWLLDEDNYSGRITAGHKFETETQGNGELTVLGGGEHALQVLYDMGSSRYYIDSNGNAYALQLRNDGEWVLSHIGAVAEVTPLTGAQANTWLYRGAEILDADGTLLRYEHYDPSTGVFNIWGNGDLYRLIGNDLVYIGTSVLPEGRDALLTGDAYIAVRYAFEDGAYRKAVENTLFFVRINATSRSNKQIYLERLTDTLARDIQDRYYTGMYNSATGSYDWSETPVSSVEYATACAYDSEGKLVGTGWSGTLGDGVNIYRQIDEYDASGKVTGNVLSELLRVRMLRIITTDGQETIHTVIWRVNVSRSTETYTYDSTEVTLPDGKKVYSDGTIELPAGQETGLQHIEEVTGVTYQLKYVGATQAKNANNEAGDIEIHMDDPAGSIMDTNDISQTAAGRLINLEAGGDISIFSESSGSIGADNNEIEMKAVGLVKDYDNSGYPGRIATSMFKRILAVDGNFTLWSPTFVTNGATYLVVTENGNIYGTTLYVEDGATLLLDANSDGTVAGVTGAVVINEVVVDGLTSDLNYNRETDELSYTRDATQVGDPGTLYITADGDIDFVSFTAANGGAATLYSTDGQLLIDSISLNDASLTGTAYGNVEFGTADLAAGSALTLDSTDAKLLFNRITAADSSVSLSAYQDIALLDTARTSPLIVMTGDGSTLRFESDFGDIGSAEKRMIIDVPAAVTPHIKQVRDYFISALDITAIGDYLSMLPDYALLSGYNDAERYDVLLSGDYLKYSDEQFFRILLNVQTDEELALWAIDRAGRDIFDHIDPLKLWAYIHTQGATQKLDAGALKKLFGAELAAELTEDLSEQPPAPATAWNESIFASVTIDALKDVLKLSDTLLPNVLTALLKAKIIALDGALLGSLLTDADIQDFYLRAMIESATPDDGYTDIPARAFSLTIGESTGDAYIYADGDITLTQDRGDVTIARIRSERGDVTVSALAGSILDNAYTGTVEIWGDITVDGVTDRMLINRDSAAAAINARMITLSAAGDVGSESAPLITEQRANHPVRLINIDEELYKAVITPAGYTVFNTEFGTRFGGGAVAGVGSFTQIPNCVYVLEKIDKLDKSGLPVLDKNGNPIQYWALPVSTRYDWLRVDYDAEATQTNIDAGGSAYIRELTGDLGAGVMTVGADLSLQTQGNVTDTRSDAQKSAGDENITAGRNVSIANGGTIGTDAYTESHDMTVPLDYDGVIRIDAEGYILNSNYARITLDSLGEYSFRFNAQGVLEMRDASGAAAAGYTASMYTDAEGKAHILVTRSIDSTTLTVDVAGEMNAALPGGIHIDATDDLVLNADSGTSVFALTATGSMTLNDLNAVTTSGSMLAGDSVSVSSLGDIGAAGAPLVIDGNRNDSAQTPHYGTLTLSGNNVYAVELSGDVYLAGLAAIGDATLTVDGTIYDAKPSQTLGQMILAASEAQKDSISAQAAVDTLTDQKAALDTYLARNQAILTGQLATETAAQTQLQADSQTLTDAQAAMALLQSDPNATTEQLAAAQAAVDQAQADYDLAQAALTAASAERQLTADNIASAQALLTQIEQDLATAETTRDNAADIFERASTLLAAQTRVNQAETAVTAAKMALAASPSNAELQERLAQAENTLRAARNLLSGELALSSAFDQNNVQLTTVSDDDLVDIHAAIAESLNLLAKLETTNAAQEAYDAAGQVAGSPEEAALNQARQTQQIAIKLMDAQQAVMDARDALTADPTNTELQGRLTQAEETLQAVKNVLAAQDARDEAQTQYEEASRLSQTAQDAAAAEQSAQSLVDDYDLVENPPQGVSQQDIDDAIARIQASRTTRAQAQAALTEAQQAHIDADAALAGYLAAQQWSGLQDAADNLTVMQNALNAQITALSVYEETNVRQAELDEAKRKQAGADALCGDIDSALTGRDTALSDLALAKADLATLKQAYEDAVLQTQKNDTEPLENQLVQDALDAYLAAQEEFNGKQRALTAIESELTALAQQILADPDKDALYSAEFLALVNDLSAAQSNVEALRETLDGLRDAEEQAQRAYNLQQSLQDALNTLADENASAQERDYAEALLALHGNPTAADVTTALSAAQTALDNAIAARDQAETNVSDASQVYSDMQTALAQAPTSAATAAVAAAGAALANASGEQVNHPVTPGFGADYAAGSDMPHEEYATITVGGDLVITAGGGVGNLDDDGIPHEPIGADVGGTIQIVAGSGTDDDVNLIGSGDMNIEGITAGGDVSLTTDGDITDLSSGGRPMIDANAADLNAIHGSVGSEQKPVDLDVNEFSGSGENVFINNEGGLTLGDIATGGSAGITAGGSVTQQPGATLIADTLDFNVSGDFGNGSNPIVVNANTISGHAGGDIGIENQSNLLAGNISGGDITIHVSGGTIGGGVISGNSLTLDVFGDIGSEADPLIVDISGGIQINTNYPTYGLVFIKNIHASASLASYYTAVFVLAIPFCVLPAGGLTALLRMYLVFGVNASGHLCLLGLYIAADDDADIGARIAGDLYQRGMRRMGVLFVDGLSGFAEAFRTVFAGTVIGCNSVLWLLNTGLKLSDADRDEVMDDLDELCDAESLEEAAEAAEEFYEDWEDAYPALAEYVRAQLADWQKSYDALAALRGAGLTPSAVNGVLRTAEHALSGQESYESAGDAARALLRSLPPALQITIE